jgi:nucleotide-binding universal stress UspA family protein
MQPHHAQPETVADNLDKVSAQALTAAVSRATDMAADLLLDTDLLYGAPARALVASAAGASMLVVGARGAGGFSAMILGSVSRYAAMHAPGPVVIAREESMAVHRQIVVGVGHPAAAGDTLGFAFEEAAKRGASLLAVHAWSHSPLPGPADQGPASAQLAEALAGWREKYPAIHVGQEIVFGHPGRVLASFSARADLVLLGRHDGLGNGAPGIGSVQHAVLNHAHGPVGVIPSAH